MVARADSKSGGQGSNPCPIAMFEAIRRRTKVEEVFYKNNVRAADAIRYVCTYEADFEYWRDGVLYHTFKFVCVGRTEEECLSQVLHRLMSFYFRCPPLQSASITW